MILHTIHSYSVSKNLTFESTISYHECCKVTNNSTCLKLKRQKERTQKQTNIHLIGRKMLEIILEPSRRMKKPEARQATLHKA